MLIILDGFGLAGPGPGNAVSLAKTPNLDALMANYPGAKLQASGQYVGLPQGQMGNSEVGHMNIGAGRVIYQSLTKIDRDIAQGDFYKKPVLRRAIQEALDKGKNLHLMGLLSKGGVHSHQRHLFAILKLCKDMGLDRVYVHAFLDGRDVSPHDGLADLESLQEEIRSLGVGKIATVTGRYYAMDRDQRYDRIEKAYRAVVQGLGDRTDDFCQKLQAKYQVGETDEFVQAMVAADYQGMDPEDSIIFYNFRPDRARQLTWAIMDENFDLFSRPFVYRGYFACMTNYDRAIEGVHIVYQEEKITNTLGAYLSHCGKKQLRIAETEKYAHVTFFFNGGVELPNEGEDRILVPSPKVATYDLKPEMSAVEVTDKLVEAILTAKYDFILLNFANPDMVGHTGVVSAAVKAVETVDSCLGRILKALDQVDGKALITADHGNCEVMVDEKGQAMTSHTNNQVPLVGYKIDESLRDGALCDLAPTILDIMGLEKPEEMTGTSLRMEEIWVELYQLMPWKF